MDHVAEPDLAQPRVAFVFPARGAEWVGMGRELLAEETAFAQALLRCDDAVRAEAGWSVLEALTTAPSDRTGDVDVAVLWAVQVALAELWRSWGVEPDVVIGSRSGEIAAAQVAGALTVVDAAAVVCRCSRTDGLVADHGRPPGTADGELRSRLGTIAPRAGRIPIHSTVLDRVVDGSGMDADYWVANLRRPPGTSPQVLIADTVFVEISPQPPAGAPCGATLSVLRRGESERACLLAALAELYASGVRLRSAPNPIAELGSGRR